jgi:hypothetical protein
MEAAMGWQGIFYASCKTVKVVTSAFQAHDSHMLKVS